MKENYFELLKSSVNMQVLIGLLAFRLLSAFLDKVLFPIIDIYLEDNLFRNLNIFINSKTKNIVLISPIDKEKNAKIEVGFGYFLKELIIFITVFTLYYFFKTT